MAEQQEKLSGKSSTSVIFPGDRANIVQRFLTTTRTADEFASYFTEDAYFRFANAPVIIGRKAIHESSVAFRQKLKSVTHDIKSMWEMGDVVVCEMEVTYTRHDGKTLKIPCCDIIRFDEINLIRSLQAFLDISPLFSS